MKSMSDQKNILVAPLNWGLGHATRCIPVIHALIENGYTPIFASDGAALELLRLEFTDLIALELPSYDIQYAENGADFKWKMLRNAPKMLQAMTEEKSLVKRWVKDYQLCGIISDNRLGVYSKKVTSVFITHQLKVLSGNTTWLSTELHRRITSKFAECWVPDLEFAPSLSGKLGHPKKIDDNVKYIGPLSRFVRKDVPQKYDLMVLLSGPEPQRGILEEQLLNQLKSFAGKVIFISGKIGLKREQKSIGNIEWHNFMTTPGLENAFNESAAVLCRSGYTTIMDLARLRKKAFFIPTPGQPEQEYLARKLRKDGLVATAKQDDFKIENLQEIDLYRGLPGFRDEVHWKQLFSLFECE